MILAKLGAGSVDYDEYAGGALAGMCPLKLGPTMFKRTTTALLLVIATLQWTAGDAAAQSTSSTYLLRQQLGSDSYLWEPMLTGRRLPQRAPLVNPAARAKSQSYARAQAPANVLPAYGAAAPQLDSAAQSVLNYYGARQAAANLQPSPRPRFIPNGARTTTAPATRPFTNADAGPTVSPYLNLFREDFDESIPNYHAFVRPQLQQQRANRRQQAEIERLERQVRAAEAAPAPTGAYGAMPATGRTAARFGDTGQFYGAGRR